MHITHEATVIVPVSDQDRALAFYVGTLGFARRADFRYGDGERWVEAAPPGGALGLALVLPRGAAQPGVETGLAFPTSDVEADHAELRERGADVDEAILREGDPAVEWAGTVLAGVPPMFRVRDPDGNSLLLVARG